MAPYLASPGRGSGTGRGHAGRVTASCSCRRRPRPPRVPLPAVGGTPSSRCFYLRYTSFNHLSRSRSWFWPAHSSSWFIVFTLDMGTAPGFRGTSTNGTTNASA